MKQVHADLERRNYYLMGGLERRDRHSLELGSISKDGCLLGRPFASRLSQ